MPGECNRECLYQFVDKYFDAMLSRCPCNLPFGPDAKYTENELAVDPGEGMWRTFSGRGTYRIYLADPANSEAGYYGDITEDNGLLVGMIALRLKVKDHRITELETITVREQKRPKGGLGLNTAGIMTPRMMDELDPAGFISPDATLLEPLAAAETRDQLLTATNGYFEAYAQGQTSLASFATQCSRRENGIAATNNPDGPMPDKRSPRFICSVKVVPGELDRGFFGDSYQSPRLTAARRRRKAGLGAEPGVFRQRRRRQVGRCRRRRNGGGACTISALDHFHGAAAF